LGGKNGKKNGDIVQRPRFAQGGGSQVQHHFCGGEHKAAVCHSGTYPVPGLLYRRVGQAHHVKGWHSPGNIRLHLDLVGFYSQNAVTLATAVHNGPPLLFFVYFTCYRLLATGLLWNYCSTKKGKLPPGFSGAEIPLKTLALFFKNSSLRNLNLRMAYPARAAFLLYEKIRHKTDCKPSWKSL